MLGFGLALLRSHLTPYILTRDQAARATSSPVIAASEGHRRRFWQRSAPELPQYEITALGAEASGALARRELSPRAFAGGGPGALLVVSASPTPNSAGIALAMAEANARDGRETLLVLADIEGTPVLPHLTGHEGLTDLVMEPAATRAIRARKLFRPGTVADLYVLPPGLNHEETAEAVGPSLVPGIVADLPPGYSVVIHGPASVGRHGITPLAAAVDASVLVVQVGLDKEMDVARLTGALQFAGAPVLGVVLDRGRGAGRDARDPAQLQAAGLGPADALMLSTYSRGHGLAPAVPGTVEGEIERPAWFWLMLWCLFVLGVQPWSSRVAAPQGTTGSTNSIAKGLLLGAVFLVAVAATKPGFRTRVNPASWLYVMYVLFACATAFLLAEPMGPLTRLARFLIGLVFVFLLWRPLVQVPEQLVRARLWAHVLLAATVVLSLVYDPGQAWRPLSSLGTGSRLQGVIIPMLPPRVGEVGAILLGLALIGLVCRKLSALPAVALIGLGGVLIAASRTRTSAAAVAWGWSSR